MIVVGTHVASDVVGSFITTGNKTNEDGDIHNGTPNNNEIIEVWTRQPNNSASTFNVKTKRFIQHWFTTHFLLRNTKLNARQTVAKISPRTAKMS